MRSYPPYKITHVSLDLQLTLPALASQGQGNYLVFWWKQIALGHLYINPGQIFSEENYYTALIAILEPTLRQYTSNSYIDKEQWQSWLLQKNFEPWSTWMNSNFSIWMLNVVPSQVPISLVICTRNRANALQLCLNSLEKMICQPAEIIIVDNAPLDSSTQKVVELYPSIKYVLEPNPGLSYARNTGIKKSSYGVIAFTDDDVLFHHNWIYRVWETFLDNRIFAMTGLVIAAELQTEAQQIFEKHWSFNRGYQDIYYYYENSLWNRISAPPVWEIGAGANCAFRKDIFQKVGFFDERLGAGASGCSEDSEMWFRIFMAGHIIHYNPRAIVQHAHRNQIKELKQQLYHYMRGHAAAALIQHDQFPKSGYRRHIYWGMFKHYINLIIAGFPFFRFRNRTLLAEVKGVVSGVYFYYRNRGPKPQPKL